MQAAEPWMFFGGRTFSTDAWWLANRTNNPTQQAFSHTQKCDLAIATLDNKTVLITPETCQVLRDVADVWYVSWSPVADLVAIVYCDGLVVAAGLKSVERHMRKSSVVRFSPDGRAIASLDVTGQLCLLRPTTLKTFKRYPCGSGGGHMADSIAWSPDSQRVAVSYECGRVWIFGRGAKRHSGVLRPRNRCLVMQFTSLSELVTADTLGRVTVWDLQTSAVKWESRLDACAIDMQLCPADPQKVFVHTSPSPGRFSMHVVTPTTITNVKCDWRPIIFMVMLEALVGATAQFVQEDGDRAVLGEVLKWL